ncbi:MAG: conjugal transfer protein TraX [Firmicutes bacterium]|nr:conjugal transfer protein TraX [Bacillota bacterium]
MEAARFRLSREQLKGIAMLTMLIDHIGAVLLPGALVLRGIGRLSFPIFCFFIAQGYAHTRSVPKYLARLLIFGVLSEVPFDLAFYSQPFYWGYQNVMWTLALGLVAIWCADLGERGSRLWLLGVLGALLAAYFGRTDYGAFGVSAVLLCHYLPRLPHRYAFGALLFAALCIVHNNLVELLGSLSFALLALYSGEKASHSRVLRYAFYAFYPLHLLALWAIA